MKIKKPIIIAVMFAFVLGFGFSAQATTIQALKVTGDIPLDPTSPFWSNYGPTKGKHVTIDMEPQMITNPMWPNPATKHVTVRAATNGKEVAVMLEWIDPTRNDIDVRSQQYRDQAALMFPVTQGKEEPPFTMGGEGERVNIWQWKATWDKEGSGVAGNTGMQDMEDQYKNMVMGSGSYYMYEPDGKIAKSEFKINEPGTKEDLLKTRGATDITKRATYVDQGMGKSEGVFNTGRAAGNIFSDAGMRKSPVEDLNAEGFSTLTTQAHQDVEGKGDWQNSRWTVVFKRTLTTADENDAQFKGNKTPMGIAIWNGQNKERNGQKAVTQWNELQY